MRVTLPRLIVVVEACFCGAVPVEAYAESPYAFRACLECVHQKGVVDAALRPATDEFVLSDGMTISFPVSGGDVMLAAARDFEDYLLVSQSVSARVSEGAEGTVKIALDGSLREREYEISVAADGVLIRAFDERAAAQALYRLEDRMNFRRAPFLSRGVERRRLKYSPRMLHSGWAVDVYPDAYLTRMAHYGYDAILLYVKDLGVTQGEGARADIPGLIRRAKKRGIDVYLYTKIRAFAHPDDPGGREIFKNTYGRLAATYPEARGIVFVGESCEFPSKDKRTTGLSYRQPRPPEEKRPDPAWYPCSDYPDWIRAVRDAVKAESPNMEIVFWTYNWSNASVEQRCKVLEGFPKDVVLNLTCFADAHVTHWNGLQNRCDDYTISVPGPAPCALGEAAFAHATGRKFYMMSNTGGMAWDFGCIPYEPFPFQWKKRWDALERCRVENGLSGLMESHHFGWYPNVVSELAKEAFTEGGTPFDVHIRQIAVRDFGEDGADAAIAAWRDWSAAIVDFPAMNMNQYGPFRIGPAYPFTFGGPMVAPLLAGRSAPTDAYRFPYPQNATHTLQWMCNLNYDGKHNGGTTDGVYPYDLSKELELLEEMKARLRDGADAFEKIGAAREATLGRYLQRTVETALNVKRGFDAMRRGDRADIRRIAAAEYENAKAALPLVEADSRLGWEPSMEYVGGPEAIRWKIKTMERLYGFGGGACDFSRVEADVSALPKEMHLVKGLLEARVAERTDPQGVAETFRVRYRIDPSVGDDAALVRIAGRTADISASRLRSLIAGTGCLLKSFTYGPKAFSAKDGAYDFKPVKSIRIAYLARHFINPFMQLDADTFCRYVDDLVLDGINIFNTQLGIPAVDAVRVTEKERADFLSVSRRLGKRFSELDCTVFAAGGSNQMPEDSPAEYRAEPNTNKKAPPTGFNACPSKPKALAALLEARRKAVRTLREQSEEMGFAVGALSSWPYDEGGCGCKACRPWGGNGYLKMIEKYRDINSAVFPDAKRVVSTWFFDDDDFAGLWKYLETHDWIDYLLVDDFGDTYPQYPLEHPIPNGKTKIITFPEISMWGRVPWGGYGAIALPKFLECLFRQSERISDGFEYYSEGLYEDINKAIVTELNIDPKQTTDTILRRYAAYHFVGCNPDDFVRLANLLETNHRPHLMERDNVAAAAALADRIDRAILPQLRTSWRWRIVWLRAMIDREIVRADNFSPKTAQPYFDELVKIYRVERQLDWVLDGNLGGWTCPNYVPQGRGKALQPPAGDATDWLNGLIATPQRVSVRLGKGDWKVGDLRISRSRLDFILEDGCRVVGRSLQVGPGVNGVTVRGEGRAVIDARVCLMGATNVIVRNVHVPGGRVSSEACGSVRIDLCPEQPFVWGDQDAADELKCLDKELEWADQHAEHEKVERMFDDLKRLRREKDRSLCPDLAPAAYWNASELFKTPRWRPNPYPESDYPGMQAVLIEGVGSKGTKAEFFAYYAKPQGPVPEGGFPGLLLVHGGGGTAYPNYIQEFVKDGFAVLAPDWYNQRPAPGLTNAVPDESTVPRVPLEGGKRQDHVAIVSNMVLAHSLLQSFPEVDAGRTVYVGLSWGSWYGSCVTAVDGRFKGACMIYLGDRQPCGTADISNGGFVKGPFHHSMKVPAWWIVWAKEGNGLPSTLQDGWKTCPCEVGRSILHDLGHSHAGFTVGAVHRMARSFAGMDVRLPRLDLGCREGSTVSARILDAGRGISKALLWYTTREPLQLAEAAKNTKTEWRSIPAAIKEDVVSAVLPAESRIAYLSVYEDVDLSRNGCASSGYFHVNQR